MSSKIVLAATKSGSGKTLITIALLKALALRGMKVHAFKCGPDYIDPMFHEKILGIPSKNLDLFFTNEETTRALFFRDNRSDISVIEGVMGLYDGLGGISEEASTYHLACALDAPIVLIVDAHGMGRSVLAQIQGFLSMDFEKRIKGVILNRVSKSFFEMLAPLIREECKIEVLGYFPMDRELNFESRYLGLKLPKEVSDLMHKSEVAAKAIEECVCVDRLLTLAANYAEECGCRKVDFARKYECGADDLASQCESTDRKKVRIGVARDEAFCFYYRDNLNLLEDFGAELVFFSPLNDESLPQDLDGLLFGGGYPELMAEKLSHNKGMLASVKEVIEKGIPTLAECGGFMYLHEGILDKEGKYHKLVGAVTGTCFDTGKLVRFGYADFFSEPLGFSIKGHEFHYFDSDNPGEDFVATKPLSGRSFRAAHVGDHSIWGYPHLYYPSEPKIVKWFIDRCTEYAKKGEKNGKFQSFF